VNELALLDLCRRAADSSGVRDKRQQLREISGGHERDRRYVWYSLRGPDLNPEEITRLTGIAPDKAWHAGDPKPRTGIPQREGVWILDSGLGESEEFHVHLDALIARMRPAWTTFVDLGRRLDVDVEAAIYLLGAQGPLVQVLPDVSVALAELNATLGFDLYAIPDDEDVDADQAGSTRSLANR
jgi:hypothetical protein